MILPDRNCRRQLKVYENQTRDAGLDDRFTGPASATRAATKAGTPPESRIADSIPMTFAREFGHERAGVVAQYTGS